MNHNNHKNEFDSAWDEVMSFKSGIYPLKKIVAKLTTRFCYDFKIIPVANREILYVGSGLPDESWGYLRGYLQHLIETFDNLVE